MIIVSNWKARRAGGRITINGVTQDGNPIKIVGVDEIAAGKNGKPPIATDKDGTTYQLA